MHQRVPNHIDNIIRPLEYVEVPKPDYSATMRFQPYGSRGIAAHLRFIGMRFAVKFDNKSRLWAEEIRNVRSNCRLAAEAKTSKLLSTKQRPELPLPVGHIPTKLSSVKLGQPNTPLPSLRDTFPHKG